VQPGRDWERWWGDHPIGVGLVGAVAISAFALAVGASLGAVLLGAAGLGAFGAYTSLLTRRRVRRRS
jgi:hypothetical protein